MWVNPCAHDILFSPTGICVQIFIWIQRKLNYSFLGKKLPAVQESSVIYNYGVFSCRGLQQRTGAWNSSSELAVPDLAAEQLYLGCDSHPGDAAEPCTHILGRAGALGKPVLLPCQSQLWFTHQKLSEIEAESTWEGWLTVSQLLPDPDSQKSLLCFLTVLQK